MTEWGHNKTKIVNNLTKWGERSDCLCAPSLRLKAHPAKPTSKPTSIFCGKSLQALPTTPHGEQHHVPIDNFSYIDKRMRKIAQHTIE